MALTQLIYSSRSFGYDAAILDGILLTARRCNARDDISGALICRQDVYLQLLEGPEQAVASCFARIGRDDRHLDIRLIAAEPVAERQFAAWAMWHDPAASWMWSADEVARGAVRHASAEEVRAIFRTATMAQAR